jgi:glucose/arabinose dehydrogenase
MLLRSSASLTAYAGSPAGAIVYLDLDDSGKILSQEIIRVGDLRVRSIEKGPDGYLYILTDATGPQSRPGRDGGAIWKIESF